MELNLLLQQSREQAKKTNRKKPDARPIDLGNDHLDAINTVCKAEKIAAPRYLIENIIHVFMKGYNKKIELNKKD